jgi:hypothetical protein
MCRGVNQSKILLELPYMERRPPRPCIIRCMLANSDWVINYGTVILAAAAIVSAWISVVSLKSSKNVLEAATSQSKATVDLVEVARAELTASNLPLLADVPQHHYEYQLDRDIDHAVLVHDKHQGPLNVSIPIRNVGRGPAFIKWARVMSINGVSSEVISASSHSESCRKSWRPDFLRIASESSWQARRLTYRTCRGGHQWSIDPMPSHVTRSEIPRNFPRTIPTTSDRSDATGQVSFDSRIIPTPPDHSDHPYPSFNPQVPGSRPGRPTILI